MSQRRREVWDLPGYLGPQLPLGFRRLLIHDEWPAHQIIAADGGTTPRSRAVREPGPEDAQTPPLRGRAAGFATGAGPGETAARHESSRTKGLGERATGSTRLPFPVLEEAKP